MVFILQFGNMVYHTDWFAYIEESLHPWDKSHLIMGYDPFNVMNWAIGIDVYTDVYKVDD